jgi:mannose-6-phosphate isomerase-like protein (cupin superfamily)
MDTNPMKTKHSLLAALLSSPLLLILMIPAQAEILALSKIAMPDNIENIHVQKISSDKNSTDFVIFVKQQVPLHKHLKHTETIYVLEGRGLFQQGDEHIEIGPGDYLRIPENTAHAVRVLSSTPLKVLSVQAPEFLGNDRVFINTQ